MKIDLRNTYIDAMETGIFDAELANEYIKAAKAHGYETTSAIEGWLGVEPIIGITNWPITPWRIGQTGYNSTYIKEMKKLTLADLKSTEWNGEGLPPVGVECMICYEKGNEHHSEITYIGDDVFCYKRLSNGKEYSVGTLDPKVVKFRPIETPEQKAARDRDEEFRYLLEHNKNISFMNVEMQEKAMRIMYEIMKDLGYRKVSDDRN